MTRYGFYFDNSRCTGCRTCVMACKDYKDLSTDNAFRKVYDYEGGSWKVGEDGTCVQSIFSYHLSISCQHCDKPACVVNCPTQAMHKDFETGIVSVDHDKCIGCGYCAMTCPYGAPKIDRAMGGSVKCDGCKDRVAEGLKPICVGSCPLRALDFDDVSTLAEKYGTGQRAIAPMPKPSITSPNINIKTAPDARLAGDKTGYISNPEEVR